MQEHGAQVITTTPTVPYIFEYSDGRYVCLFLEETSHQVFGVEYKRRGIINAYIVVISRFSIVSVQCSASRIPVQNTQFSSLICNLFSAYVLLNTRFFVPSLVHQSV